MLKRKLDICDNVEQSKYQKINDLNFAETDLRSICDKYFQLNYQYIYKNGVQYDEIIDVIKKDLTLIINISNDILQKEGTRQINLQEAMNAYVDNQFDLVNTIMCLTM